jgi:hypothetical protein
MKKDDDWPKCPKCGWGMKRNDFGQTQISLEIKNGKEVIGSEKKYEDKYYCPNPDCPDNKKGKQDT